MRKLIMALACMALTYSVYAQHQPEFSTAGFYKIPGAERDVKDMNTAWRFFKGKSDQASQVSFDDSNWGIVSLPHGLEYNSTEASGCTNYQGEAWYRKHFTPSQTSKRQVLYFEGIMGKSKVYVNGQLVKENFGGFLPVIADVTDYLIPGKDNVIAVWADNSDDPSYPPGKAQNVLDFSYFGGIYRDCWLVQTNDVFITDPNQENEVAGGGLVVAFDQVSDKQADILLKLQLRNQSKKNFSGSVNYQLIDAEGKVVASAENKVSVSKGNTATTKNKMKVSSPELWEPDAPNLYGLVVTVKDKSGKVVDGYKKRIGIRSIEFKGADGLWLNGKPYEVPLIGANRHQDFAVIGNALPNSLHWRDAKKLRDAGMRIIRNAHYPQDPAFMDACDELGLFVIVNTPGWQFWNPDPLFAERVYGNIRDMVRRDRNRPSVFLWEPILNETWYPEDFAKRVKDIVTEEFPYKNSYSACDHEARGSQFYDIQFTHPVNADKEWALKEKDSSKTYFTREWGDNVDDWNSHNSPSRVHRAWGEEPMLVQTRHYANPPYPYTTYDVLYQTDRQHVGGTLWHSFDHQRGYHPDPFYGGVMDVFRQPKYSYYMFMAQRPKEKLDLIAESGPMIYIAHEMTPFSSPDVTVFSNCDEVRLTVAHTGKTYTYKKDSSRVGMPSPVITFKDVYDFMDDKKLAMAGKGKEVYMLAEGLIDGKVVATYRREPARRPSKIVLWLDNEDVSLRADGSDMVTVVAGIADNNGNIKRLNNYFVKFHVEGEGKLVGDAEHLNNPRPVLWGTAPALIQSTNKAGKIKVTAEVLFEGQQMPAGGELIFESVPTQIGQVFDAAELEKMDKVNNQQIQAESFRKDDLQKEVDRLKKELNNYKLKEVEKQQAEFGEKN